jgi:hypothetical protein
MRFCLEINLNSNFDKIFHSINDITYLSFKHTSLIEGESDFSKILCFIKNSPLFVQSLAIKRFVMVMCQNENIFKEFSLKLQKFCRLI